jgi:hypothetical protein
VICKFVKVVVLVLALSGCSSTIPASYEAQAFVDIGEGDVAMGDFSYLPALSGSVKQNQLQNTAVGSIFIGEGVAEFVKRAAALEMERGGLNVGDRGEYNIIGEISEFLLNDLGYSVDWTYSVRYVFTETQSNLTVFDKTYRAPLVTTAKFGLHGDYTALINSTIIGPIESLMRDIRDAGRFIHAASIADQSSPSS